MVGNLPPVTLDDLHAWSMSVRQLFSDRRGLWCFGKYANTVRHIQLPEGECTHFPHFTIRPITCSFKWLYINADAHQYSFVLNSLRV
jgi:hypothetical protein